MSRETRNNLIFLAIISALVVPGMVVLFIKKLDPEARKMYLPDPVSDRIAYMDPEELPPGKRRVIPPKTAAWVRTVATKNMGADGVAVAVALRGGASALPLMSDNKVFELAAVRVDASTVELGLIVWDQSVDATTGRLGVVLHSDDGRAMPNDAVVEVQNEKLEQHVRNELGDNGLNVQPDHAVWARVRARRSAIEDAKPWKLTLTFHRAGGSIIQDQLTLPGASAMRSLQ